jgi:thiamine biosynthesis protein ThiS
MSDKTVSIIANGKPTTIPECCTIEKFLESYGWKCTQVVVEHNATVVSRVNIGKVVLQQGDRLEVIEPVSGG